jgi:hypothetical protein
MMELNVAANQYSLLGLQDRVEELLGKGMTSTTTLVLHLALAVHAPRLLVTAIRMTLSSFDERQDAGCLEGLEPVPAAAIEEMTDKASRWGFPEHIADLTRERVPCYS